MTYVQGRCEVDGVKRRLTQRRKDARKGQNDGLLGTEKTALLGGLCGFARPRRCLNRRLTQRRQDAKKDKNGYSRLAAASQTVEWSGLAVAAESEGRPRDRRVQAASRRSTR